MVGKPPFRHPKCWWFLVGKAMVVGVSPSFLANFPWVFSTHVPLQELWPQPPSWPVGAISALCAQKFVSGGLWNLQKHHEVSDTSPQLIVSVVATHFFLNFHPDFVGKWSNLTDIFQMACNHRLVMCRFCFLFWYFWNHFLYVSLTVKLSFFIQQLLPMKMWKFEGFATENRP